MAGERFFQFPALRYSIRQLILGMALVALACVALRNAGPVWTAALLGGMLLLLGAAIPLTLFREGPKRAFWFGFAVFGWLYLLVLAYGWSLDPSTSASNPLRPQALVTSHVTGLGYDKLYPAANQTTTYGMSAARYGLNNVNGTLVWMSPDTGTPMSWDGTSNTLTGMEVYFAAAGQGASSGPAREHFVNVAHAFWALLISLCGGWLSCWVYATRPSQPAQTPA